MKALVTAVVFLLIASGVTFADVNTDWDKTIDFSVYKTYSWPKVKTPNELWDKRVMTAIDSALQSKRWV